MNRFVPTAAAVWLAVLLTGITPPAEAQQQPGRTAPDYTRGNTHLPNIFRPYTPMYVADPVLTNSPRIES